MAGPFTVEELSQALGGEPEGDASVLLVDARGLAEAGPEHLSFLANPKYARQLGSSRAGAVLVDRRAEAGGRTVIRCADPYVAFARALALFHPLEWPEPGVDPRAHVAPDAQVDGATIEAFAWVGPGAVVGPGSWVEPGAYVGAGSRIGERCRLMPASVVCAGCTLGDRVWLNPGAVIGSEGFGFAPTALENVKIPQAGVAVIEDDVEIGANSCVDRAAMGETAVRRGAKLDNLVQIGHGAEVGERSMMAAYAGLSGSTRIGKGVIFAAKTGAAGHLRIGDGVRLATHGIITRDQPDGAQLAGLPAIDQRRWRRAVTVFGDLPELLARLRRLERRVAELEGEQSVAGDPVPGAGE